MSAPEATVSGAMRKHGPIETIIDPRLTDLGEFTVRRTLPAERRQRVGPFVFFDHMGPADFEPGSGVNVRPHPHIGIATITYLFAGEIMHRDSLGSSRLIEKGAINWMTAGSGIVHSERTPAELQQTGSYLHGIQAWVALPLELEETKPRFEHYPADAVPALKTDGARLRIIAGEAFDLASPVRTSSETLYVEADIDPGSSLSVPGEVDELAAYVVDGEIQIEDCTLTPGKMAVLRPAVGATIQARAASKVMLLGGATLPGKRYVWWNFVTSSRERLEQAKADWLQKRFDEVPGETEFIPLPES